VTLTRRTSLRRKGPLRARTRIKAKRSKPRRGPQRHSGYVEWVRTQPCRAMAGGGCQGRVHAHHAGERGLGQKADDRSCIPLCAQHHRDWHDCAGQFRGWSHVGRWAWALLAIDETQKAYAAR
jgi:hypothetical protein